MGRRQSKRWAIAALLMAAAIMPAAASDYSLAPGQAAVGVVGTYVARANDILLDTARDHDLGFTQLMAANPGVNPWLPGAGKRIVLPSRYILPDAPHQGIVINLAEQRLFYFPPGGDRVETFPIGIGVIDATTPLGATRVTDKTPNPTWHPPPSIRAEEPDLPAAIPPGPDNPLGAFALRLGWPNYLIHGTNKPDGVGRNVSHGCIRLYPEDIARLFREVSIGTPVRVVDQEVKTAWIGNTLYVEVHTSKAQAEEIATKGSFKASDPPDLVARVTAAAQTRGARIAWYALRRAGLERTGLLVAVAKAPSEAMGNKSENAARAER